MKGFTIVAWRLFLMAGLFTFFFADLPARAGEITLVVNTTTRVTQGQVDLKFEVTNRGTAAARDVALKATLLGQNQTAWVARRIAQEETRTTNVGFELPPDARGTFPVFISLTYHSRDGKAYGLAALAVVRTSGVLATNLKLNVTQGAVAGGNYLRIVLMDPTRALSGAILYCHLPDDLKVSQRTGPVQFKDGKALTGFMVNNHKGSPDSRYGVFITAEYDRDGVHYLAYTPVSITVEGIKKTGGRFFDFGFEIFFAMGLLGLGGMITAGLSPKVRKRLEQIFHGQIWSGRMLDCMILLIVEGFILIHLSPQDLLSETITTGGDTASHYYTLHYLRNELLPMGRISGWTPGNYGGFPILQFYFPLSFLLMCGLDTVMPLQIAFKWVTLMGTFLLPVAVYIMLRLLRCPFPGPAAGAALTLPFLFNGENSMWGGNLLSTLSGEFSYSLSLALTFILLGSLYRGCLENRRVILNALLVFLVGFSHGYTLLFAAGASLFFLFTPHGFFRRLIYLCKVYVLGFLLLSFWLIPLLAFAKFTTPYHSAWHIDSFQAIVPVILLPLVIAAGISSIGLLVCYRRPLGSGNRNPVHVLGFLGFALVVAGVLFVLAPRIGVVDIRYVPVAQLIIGLIAALGLGWLGAGLHRWRMSGAYLLMLVGAILAWTTLQETRVPAWAKWNYEGFEARSGWPLFQKINKALEGTFQDPRVVFEHASEHNIFGSTRAFESLPLFAGRATLEGLYMQASISAPFIFYIQSEISSQKSCPFKQYACTDMDFTRARRHLAMFNVRDLILRSPEAKAAIQSDPAYGLQRTLDQYQLWRLKGYRHRYVVPLTHEPVLFSTKDWKNDSYQWFVRDDLLDTHLVFTKKPTLKDQKRFKLYATSMDKVEKIPMDVQACRIKETIRKNEILIETNWINKPLLIRVSYHPNWQVRGADKIYLVSPSFMLVFPNQEKVRLYFGSGRPDRIGWVLTGLGLVVLILNVPLPWKGKPTVRSMLAGPKGLPSIWKPRLKWDPPPAVRRFILAGALVMVTLTTGWIGYHIYAGDPNRIFNQAVKLKDARRFDEARQGFQQVLSTGNPWSALAHESAYYVGICYYLQHDDPAAIRAFEELIAAFPNGRRNQEAHYHVGLCFFRSGQEQAGIMRMKLLLERYPGTLWARFARERLIEHNAFDAKEPGAAMGR